MTTVRWWKNGDHPDDHVTTVRDPETGVLDVTEGEVVKRYQGNEPDVIDPSCGQAWGVHGVLGDTVVHPGDWLTVGDDGATTVERPALPTDEQAAQIETPEEQ